MGYVSADSAERWLSKESLNQPSSWASADRFEAALDGQLQANSRKQPQNTPTAADEPPKRARTTFDYTVAPGDTIWDLAITYSSSVDEIVSVNPQFRPGSGDSTYNADYERTLTTGRDADAIWPGEVLKIPMDALPTPPVQQTAPEPAPQIPPTAMPAPPVPVVPQIPAPMVQPTPVNTACALPAAPYLATDDPLADNAMWGKQGAFATRVLTRLGLAPSAGAGLDSASKVIGLGGFGILNGVQKGAEVVHHAQNGDWGRAVASGVEGLNGFRIGATGVTPLLGAGGADWISKNLGGAAGTKLGVGANIIAGAGRAYSIEQRYDKTMACADTDREMDQAQYDRVDAHLSNVLDTGNDIVPYVGDSPVNWGTWLGGKVMDHAAAEALGGSGYKPRSIGADHVRDEMPLLAAAGLVPTIEQYDVTTAKTDDERIVMEESNSIDKAAGIGSGVADITVTATEVGLVSYYGGGKPEAIYGVLQADHMLRQGANIWTDHAWQRPSEREAAVVAAGLDPALDPHKVEYEQEDFVHRTAASLTADANIARLEGKAAAGGATADEKRYLEIVKQFESADISDNTSGRGSNDGLLSPHGVWETMKATQPGLIVAEKMPDMIGFSTGWIQGGGIGNTVDAVKDKVGDVKDDVVGFAKDAGSGVVHFVDNAGDLAGGVTKKLFGWM
jgi:hypothetical protein